MAIRSLFRDPGHAVITGVLLGGASAVIYAKSLPPLIDIRMAPPNNDDVEAQRKHAALTSAAIIIGVSAITRDANVFIIAGAMFGLTDYLVKHANGTNPATGKLDTGNDGLSIVQGSPQYHPLPEYQAG
jgi:hypothetical protein